MDKYLYWLDRTEGLGTIAKRNLIEAFGTAEEVYRACDNHLKYILNDRKSEILKNARNNVEIDKPFQALLDKNIQMCCYHDTNYPQKLIDIPDPPFCLYYRGKLPDEKIPSVAIIGARECSAYGEYIASELGKTLGSQGIQVISGMARGIDGISQWTALETGGVSYGVLGCGVDVCYPKSNQKLYDKLLIKGGILSTYPPGTKPQSKLFPPRNRIVSGLSDVLVVIEARQRSGTSITVEMALEQGREIYAIPGRITDRLSDGCNKMLKEGAHVFLSPEDLMMDLEEMLPVKMAELRKQQLIENDSRRQLQKEATKDKMNEDSKISERENNSLGATIINVLDFYPQSVETIKEKLKREFHIELKHEELTSELIMLCLLGVIEQDSSSWFSRKR